MRSLIAAGLILWLGTAAAGPFDKLFGGNGSIDLGRIVSSAKQAFGEVSEEQERTIGHEAAAVLLGAVPLVDDAPLQRYVNRVGRWVALHTERPDIPWRFGVLDTLDVNAFAAPGGYIFITRGLLLRLNSEAELAGVLAHECAHVLKHHHLEAVQTGAKYDLAAAVVSAAVEEEQREQLDKIAGSFKELYARGLDKDDEFEADRMGIIIAARAGYDPFGLPASLQTLAGMSPEDSSLAFMFKTHPAPSKRLEQLDTAFAVLEPLAGQPAVAERFRQQVAPAADGK